MNEPTITKVNGFFEIAYTTNYYGQTKRMKEAFKNEVYANAYYLTKLREYKIATK